MRNRGIRLLLVLLAVCVALEAKKKNPDDITQVLELPKDPPMVAIGETRRLVFHVSPLSAKGLLSQQTRDAMKAILKASGGAQVVHVRALVAGSGDVRRIPQIVSEVLTDKKMALPSVSVVQVGGLPLVGAQVVLEAVSAGKKDVNPGGLGFIEGQQAAGTDKALELLVAKIAGAMPLRVSCFVSALSGIAEAQTLVAGRFPMAAVSVVQTLRAPTRTETTCEAVTRGGPVKASRLAFSGTQVGLGFEEKAAVLAFQRLDKELAEAGATAGDIVSTSLYPVTTGIGEMTRKLRAGPGSITVVVVEGVASLEAGFAADVVASVSK